MATSPSSFRPAGSLPSAPVAAYDGPWNARLAAHLLRRAGFGGSPSDVAHYAAMSAADAVTALVRFPSTASYPEPQLTDDTASEMALAMMARAAGPNDAELMQRRQQQKEIRKQQNVANVTWWLNRMLVTPAPLQEKMTLFLHGHFATAGNTKGIYGLDIVEQNELLRRYALGNWRELTHYVARDRAMLKWLDNARSLKAHPNENFARELMELFTLGVGNYTEQDERPRLYRFHVRAAHGRVLFQRRPARRRLEDVPRPHRKLQRRRHRRHPLPATGGIEALRHQAARVLRLYRSRTGTGRRVFRAHP